MRTACEIKKDNPEIICKYAAFLMKSDNLYKAQEQFDKAYSLDNNYIDAVIGSAECLLKLKKSQEAIDKLSLIKIDTLQTLNIKLFANINIYQNTKNPDKKHEILELCDKIEKDFGENTLVEKIKKMYLSD